MTRKKNTPVAQATSVQQTAADIPVQDLKARFQARSIPLETDFWDLIDVADCGRKAAGLSPDVTPLTDTGLVLDNATGQLKVHPEPNKGIIVDGNGIGVNLGFGLVHSNNAIAVSNTRISFERTPTNGRYEIAWGPVGIDNFVEIIVFAKTITPVSQERFKIIAMFRDENNYVLSIEDAFRTGSTSYVFGYVYLSKSNDGNICVELQVTHSSAVDVLVSYSIFDVNCNVSQLTSARAGTVLCTVSPGVDVYVRSV